MNEQFLEEIRLLKEELARKDEIIKEQKTALDDALFKDILLSQSNDYGLFDGMSSYILIITDKTSYSRVKNYRRTIYASVFDGTCKALLRADESTHSKMKDTKENMMLQTVYVSAMHTKESEIHGAYLEALFEYEANRGKGHGIYIFSKRDEYKRGDIHELTLLENDILRCSLYNEQDKKRELIKKYIIMISDYPYIMQRMLLSSILFHAEENEEMAIELLLAGEDKTDEIKKRLSEKKEDDTYSDRFKKIVRYINAHLREDTLSALEVAEHFNISQSSLTREFKNNMESTFSDYVHRERIEIAKKLLSEKKLPVKDVATEVGYTNTLSLTRAFHKYEGITPGSYNSRRSI